MSKLGVCRPFGTEEKRHDFGSQLYMLNQVLRRQFPQAGTKAQATRIRPQHSAACYGLGSSEHDIQEDRLHSEFRNMRRRTTQTEGET